MSALSAARDPRGVAMLEFLIAFVPIFVLFLGLLQLALLTASQLIVKHAASAAVRSASVVLDDDPRRYDGAPRGVIASERSARADDGFERTLFARLGLSGERPRPTALRARDDNERMAAIRRAAYLPLAAVARLPRGIEPGADGFSEPASAAFALRSGPSRLAAATPAMSALAALTFPVAAGGELVHVERVPLRGPVNVRLTLALPCEVPLAASLMCDAWSELRSRAEHEVGWPARVHVLDLASAPGSHQRARWLAAPRRLAILGAEATLPIHAAPYRYLGERESDR